MMDFSLRTRWPAFLLNVLLCNQLLAAPPPSKVAPGQVSMITTEVPNFDMPRVDASILIEAPLEKVWALVSNCDRYGEFMTVEESKTLWRKGKIHRCKLVVDVPFPFGTLEGISDATLNEEEGVRQRRWKLVKGDFSYNQGHWDLRVAEGGHTRVSYSLLANPDLPLPKGTILNKQKENTRGMLTRLRARALASK